MGPPPGERRDAIDVARVLALLVVVIGHLSLAVVDRAGGSVRGANLLALHPGWAWLAVAAPMPVFFAAAGWANAGATLSGSAGRLRSLVGNAAVVVGVWSFGVVVAAAVAGDPGVVADGARIATQPVWFLAAYVPFAACGGTLARIGARHPLASVGGSLAALALLDLTRFGLGGPSWVGWPGFFLAWGVPWLLGGWWRERSQHGFQERRTGLALTGCGLAAAVALVRAAGYAPALIDAVPGARSNTTPPTLYTAVVAVAQVGVLLMVATWLDVLGRRFRAFWDRAGEAAVGVYLWHLSALALCAGVISLGFPTPERLTAAWWATRPLWWAAVVALAAVIVAAVGAVRARLRRRGPDGGVPGRAAVIAGVALATVGAALVGLRGPRTVPLAVACSALLVAAWLSLRAPAARRHRP